MPVPTPVIAAPPPFVDRRVEFRRAADRLAHEETRLLAQALDILARDAGAETRLAGVLDLLARTVRATRTAILTDGSPRTVVALGYDDEPQHPARDLGAWIDATSDRSRAERAAATPAEIAVAAHRRETRPAPFAAVAREDGEPSVLHRLAVPVPGSGNVTLAFEFDEPTSPEELAERLPPNLARHAAVALALVSSQMATERELETLRAREAERTQFVSTVAHELRTPLTGLGGYLDLILDGKVGDEAVEREFLERGRDIVASIAELVGDLLELSRLESGTIRLDLAPFSVAEVGTRVVAGLDPIAMERGIALEANLPPRMRMAIGDRRRVEQILTNLVGNALKFVGAGGRVQLDAVIDGVTASYLVRDDGAGIAADDRSRIFERFYRMAAHEKVTGTGLGLPIARDLARAMSGELDVASVPGSGTTFVLVLPAAGVVDRADVRDVATRAMAAEEQRFEEQAVLRAIEVAGGSIPTVRRRPRLRAIDGGAVALRETRSSGA